MHPETQVQEGERALAHIWKATALRGVLAIAFAVVILIWPNIGLSALIALFGAYALVSGATTIAGAFRAPIRGDWRAWLVFEGLLGIAVGVVVFVWPDLSALGLLYAIAAWAIALGIFEIAARVRPPAGRWTVAAARAERHALGRVRGDHVRPPRRRSSGLAGAHRGVRARDRRRADRLRARAQARRGRARPPRPAAYDGEACHARLRGAGRDAESTGRRGAHTSRRPATARRVSRAPRPGRPGRVRRSPSTPNCAPRACRTESQIGSPRSPGRCGSSTSTSSGSAAGSRSASRSTRTAC